MKKPIPRCRANHCLQMLAFLCLSAVGVLWLGGCSQTLDKTTNLPRSARFGEAENLSEERALALPDNPSRPMKAGTPPGRTAFQEFPGLRPSLEEEVWVIARSSDIERPNREDRPGSGSLWTRVEEREVAVPLKHTDVHASIDGYIATVSVTQEFHNPYAGKIEASYVFPLPENAAVNEFVMTIGSRRIRGIIRERQQAEEIYRDARRQGYTASLLTQERPNVFVQSVANIEPGREIDVTLKYFHTLACVDGWFDFVFPMVVGPRFNPPGTSQGVGAVGRGHRGLSGQRTEVSYLTPVERSGHDISLEVDVRPGMAIEELTCPSHRTEVEKAAPEHQRVRLSLGDSLPNKDFVLRFRLDGDELKSSLLVHRDERGGFFSLMLMPPRALQARTRQPVEMIFVLDSSGSMSGRPIEQAKAAIGRGLELLSEDDTFQLIDFSDHASQFGPSPLPATPYHLARARRYLGRLQGSGGTMMLNGIKAALNFPHDPDRLRFVCFLTDGYIGNEAEILREVQRRLGDARIFSFGVGTSPNRYLLNSMAKLGRGAVAYLAHEGDPVRTMDTFFESVSHPALTDLRIDWGGLDAREVFPRRIPDLFAGRPVLLTGRCRGRVQEMVRVSGKVGRQRMQLEIPVDLADHADGSRAFPSVWARMKIADLADEAALGGNPLRAATVRQLALDYQLMSAYTAFVAVDARERTAGRLGTTVPVPVPVPEGVRYDTTVEE